MDTAQSNISHLVVEFLSLNSNSNALNNANFTVTNWTDYDIERDIHVPVDVFTLHCEDDRVDQLVADIEIGMKVRFRINNHTVMIGFIDTVDIGYDPNSNGKHLTISGRDLLGMASDATCYPNLNQNRSISYQFDPNDTLEFAIKTIFVAFPQITKFVVEDGQLLTFANGFGMGVRAKGKSGRGLSKSLQTNLQHLCTPRRDESYLAYAERLCKLAGKIIKMAPGTDDTLIVAAPCYDRTNQSPFKIIHKASGDKSKNNVKDGMLRVSWKEQPSVIIGEMTSSNTIFNKEIYKVVCINEFTGYDRSKFNIVSGGLNLDNAIPNVKDAVKQLTTGNLNNGEDGSGYFLLEPNNELFNALPDTIVNQISAVSRPKYYVDYNAHTNEELKFAVAKVLAEYQDKYLHLEYTVSDHTYSDGQGNFYVWYPNCMCSVLDEGFSSKSISGNFWIEKVVFRGGTNSGTTTTLKLNIPYIHQIEVS